MPQLEPWEREYQFPLMISLGEEPQVDLKKALKFLRKKREVALEGLQVLDLGSGNGKNSIYLAEKGNNVIGIELSPTAVAMAKQRAEELDVDAQFRIGDIGQPYPFKDASFDLILDIMSSNSLNEAERAMYLKEMHRVLRPGGHIIYRGLCKDTDKNATALVKKFPGPEHDTYIMPTIGLTERVFTREDFTKLYSQYFTILELEKKTNYVTVDETKYKRNYWVAILAR